MPCSGWGLGTPMMGDDALPLVKRSAVRSDRNASPKSCGTSVDNTGGRSPRTAGTRPSSGRWSCRLTSSGVLTVSSRCSTTTTSPTVNISPTATAIRPNIPAPGPACWGVSNKQVSQFGANRNATDRVAHAAHRNATDRRDELLDCERVSEECTVRARVRMAAPFVAASWCPVGSPKRTRPARQQWRIAVSR